jgi:hypothetical protein
MVVAGFLAVETCSKVILASVGRHGKSPCFLQVAFLRLLSPDYLMLSLLFVDGQKNM